MAATGSYFTWNNKQEAHTRVYSRLDRALVNHTLLLLRPDYYAYFHVEGYFDHTPCLIQRTSNTMQKKRCFKYFNMWSGVEQFIPCIKHVWGVRIHGTPMYQFVKKLKMLKQPLRIINKELFADVENNAMRAWQHLEFVQKQLRSDPTNPELVRIEIAAAKEFQELQKASERFLLQKSKAIWLTEGDTNSRISHSYMKGRQEKNKVLRIADEQGVWHSKQDHIQQAFLAFYKALLGETKDLRPINTQVVQRVPTTKASGPNGYSSAFYKDAWSVIGEDLCTVVKDFFRHDLKKAYDSVNGSFLSQMLVALRFPPYFTKLIMECVSTASYSLVLNGEPFGLFQGKKGLRQGDHVSPLLFTIPMEYLTRILQFTTEVQDFKFHSLCGRLRVHHLMFADDLLLFSRRDKQSVMDLLRSFATFSAASGLHMNKQKSNIYFNGVQGIIKEQIIRLSGCVEGRIPFKYLGVPVTVDKFGKKDCQVLIEKIIEKIRSFGGRKNSYAGRLIMVQSVLTYLFNYWANIFLIPKGVLKKIDSGLGIRYSLDWNIATIGKLVWWIFSKPDSLWVKWVQQIYLKGAPWDSYLPKSHMNRNWKAICKVKDVLKDGYDNGVILFRYSRLILEGVCSWLHINVPNVNGIIWISRRNWAPIQKSICIASLMAVYYNVWHQQNVARLEGVLLSPRILVAQIKSLIRSRIQQLRLDTVSASDKAWISLVVVNPI
ncbi:uncharacterized protein LOC141630250 [Silene latifolia]|uniref:uncharacterized protein LOC141630250 n=1 Tax=Silene latifolia TaxID=37657 RepID=UPI003D789824